MIDAVLKTCPDLKILATSREVLSILGEATYRVPSLEVPDSQQLAKKLRSYESVRLFEERAQLVRMDFSLTIENASSVAMICNRLDGIPLAIELAAARVSTFSIDQIAARLGESFSFLSIGNRTALPRHQTLRAAIDWSYSLLSLAEQTLFQRLSVFVGGWTLEAAESICSDANIPSEVISSLLSQLINKSLVVAQKEYGKTRYRMLETIRQYANEKLVELGEDDTLRNGHLEYFLNLAETAEPNLRTFDMVMWLDQLETELDNIRVALEYALASDVEAQLRLASALLWFWHLRGHKNEGVDWLERGLSVEAAERGDQPLTPDRAMIRGKALNVSGILWSILGRFEKTRTRSEQALALFQQLGSRGRVGMAYALLYLADAAVYLENPRSVKILAEESLTLFQEVGDKFGMAQCLDILGWVVSVEGDSNQVKAIWEENLALRKEIGDRDGIARVLARLGMWALSQGDLNRSVSLHEEGLAIFREVGNEWARSFTLANLALVFQAQGDYGKATQILEEALVLARDLGDKYRASQLLYGLGRAAQSQGEYERATQMYAEALILAREIGEPPAVAEGLQALGRLALARGDYEEATQQFETELAIGQEKQIDGINALALSELGRVAWAQGDFALARTRFEEALTISREVEAKNIICVALYGLGRVLQSKKDYASARALYVEALATAGDLGLGEGIASNLEALATLLVAQSDMEHSSLQVEDLRRAIHLFGAAETLYPPLRFEMSAKERTEHDQAVAAAHVILSEDDFAKAWTQGQAMTVAEAVTYALKED
jgi:predicted ATPase/Tfp pilus assembly protein PilF